MSKMCRFAPMLALLSLPLVAASAPVSRKADMIDNVTS